MNPRLCAYFGNPWIGMFIKTNDEKTFVPVDTPQKLIDRLSENLKTEVIRLSIADSNLLGVYLAMNSNGVVLPAMAGGEEVSVVKKAGLNVYISKDKNNANGNNVLVNDYGALCNSRADKFEIKNAMDVLGVDVSEGKIADYPTVGSTCVANNRGFLAHFAASDDDFTLLKRQLKVNGAKGSINMGAGFIPYGVVSNKHGYVAGEASSAFELGRVEESLGYLD